MNTERFFVGRAIGVLVLLVLAGFAYVFFQSKPLALATSFEECVALGNPVMESYPRQCRSADGQNFTEYIGNVLEKADLIRVTSPLPNTVVGNPVVFTGEARGNWYFEASFPVYVIDWDGKIIGEGFAGAVGDWMTTEFVPFTAEVTYNPEEISGQYSKRGTIILKKDNPSGLPEHDDALEYPILFP